MTVQSIWKQLKSWWVLPGDEGTTHHGSFLPEEISVLLASSVPGASFRSRIGIVISPDLPERSKRQQQITLYNEVRSSATQITRHFSVRHLPEAQTAIDMWLADPSTFQHLRGTAEIRIQLSIDPGEQDYSARWEKMHKEKELVAEKHQLDLERNAVLCNDILRNPVQARLWWLGGDRDRLLTLVQQEDTFEKVADLLSGSRTRANPVATELTDLVKSFLSSLDLYQKDLLLKQLDRVFASYERQDLSDRLNDMWTVEHPEGTAGEHP